MLIAILSQNQLERANGRDRDGERAKYGILLQFHWFFVFALQLIRSYLKEKGHHLESNYKPKYWICVKFTFTLWVVDGLKQHVTEICRSSVV